MNKLVALPIQVPEGKHCWDSSIPEICEHFSNDGGNPVCDLDLGVLKYGEFGVLKPKKCLLLKVVSGSKDE